MMTLFITVATGTTYQNATVNSWLGGTVFGSTSQTNTVLTTNGATFQLTGVMLNPGAFALPFEKRSIQQELQLCERYYEKSFPVGTAVAQNSGVTTNCVGFLSSAAASFGNSVQFRARKRASPTVTTYNPSASNASWRDTTNSADRTFVGGAANDNSFFCYGSSGASGADNRIHWTASARM
jgi:hypothetical protein